MKKIRLTTFLMLAAALFCGRSFRSAAAVPDEQRSLAIYQIMVASFQHSPEGAPGYTAMWGPDGHTKNGNIKGITAALDHIASLGVNAVWLTPVFDSSTASGGEKLQATGYFTNDYFAIDPHFGTDADFREFVDEAHRRGLYVILDGVFGHHGGVTNPSPSGYTIDSTTSFSDRGEQGGTGNVKYPESLPYFKEVATYWIDRYGVDGWRLDQAYQATQGGHNYWNEIRKEVEDLAATRRSRGEKWGTLGYMVGEDWGTADVINRGVYRDGGLTSAFDFDGKELISGPMQDPSGAGLTGGWDDVQRVLSQPRKRGYSSNDLNPNLFLSNHDGYRLADRFDTADSLYYRRLMLRNGILAAYPGAITLYYGDEYADRSRETSGAQKDNIARTSGHLDARTPGERALKDYISAVLHFRAANPAVWRGKTKFKRSRVGQADVLTVYKTDGKSGNRVAVIFSDADADVRVNGLDAPVHVDALVPLFVKIR